MNIKTALQLIDELEEHAHCILSKEDVERYHKAVEHVKKYVKRRKK